jgi:hypothetical protein
MVCAALMLAVSAVSCDRADSTEKGFLQQVNDLGKAPAKALDEQR